MRSRPLCAILKSQRIRISKNQIQQLREQLEQVIVKDGIPETAESGDFIPNQLIASVVNSGGRALESGACQEFLEYVISLYALEVSLSLLPEPFNSIQTELCIGSKWKELSAVLGTDSLATETNLITILCTAILKLSDDIGFYVSFMEQMLVKIIQWESAENVVLFLNCIGEGPLLSTHGDSSGEKIVSRCLRILLLGAQFATVEEKQRIMGVAELLVLRGADILAPDTKGNTPLSFAIEEFEMREFERFWDCVCCGSDWGTVETLEKATNLLQEGSSSDSISNILIVVGKLLDMEPGLVDMVVRVFLPQTNRLYLESLLKYAKSGTLDCEIGHSGSDDDGDDDDSDGDDDGTNSKDFGENMSDTEKECPFSWSLSTLTAMLCAAAKSSDWDTFSLVLGYAGPLAGHNSAGMTALHVLAELQDELSLAKLNAILDTQNPLDICDARDQHNFTPLMGAVHHGNIEAVKRLLNAGADSTMTEDHGYNALHIAAFQGQEACAEQLLFYRADLKSVSKYGSTPLLSSAYARQWNMVRYFLRRSDVDPTILDFQGISLVHYLSQTGGEETLETLIKQRPNLNLDFRDDRGMTPLLIAIQHNNMKACELLISHGVLTSYKFPAQYLVLLSAVAKEQRLLKYELDWLARNTIYTGSNVIGDATALHLATSLGHINMLLFILEQNLVDVNSCAADGVTPLHVSIMEDLGVCFDILLNFGADVNLRTTSSGVDSLQLAENYDRPYMLEILRGKGYNLSQMEYSEHKLRRKNLLDDLGNFTEGRLTTAEEETEDIDSDLTTPASLPIERRQREIVPAERSATPGDRTIYLSISNLLNEPPGYGYVPVDTHTISEGPAETIFSQHDEKMDQDSAISTSLPLRERNPEIIPMHSSALINESTAEIPIHRTMVYRLQPVDTEEANKVLNSLESRAANEEQAREHYVETPADTTHNKQSHEHYQIETHAENKIETCPRQTGTNSYAESLTKDTPNKPSHSHQPAPAMRLPSTSSPSPAYMIWTPAPPPSQDSSSPNPVPDPTPDPDPNPCPNPNLNPNPPIPPPQKNTQALPFVVVSQEGEPVLRGVMKGS